jgi:hypothetical protein
VTSKAEEYRAKAGECENRAEQMHDSFIKQQLLDIAQKWRHMADHLEKTHCRPPQLAASSLCPLSFAHASHCRQLASNSLFAASSVATRLSVRRLSGLLGKCNAQNHRRCSGPPRTHRCDRYSNHRRTRCSPRGPGRSQS